MSFKKIIISLLNGRILQEIKADKIFPLIIFIFALAWVSILTRMMVQQKMNEVEKNKRLIKELKIEHAQKTIVLNSFNRISKIEALLKKQGSRLRPSNKPAYTLDN